METRYELLRYKTPADRLNCPACKGRKTFAPYVDNETGLLLDESCGRCNRSDSCGHHLPPREYFARHPDRKPSPDGPATPLPRPPAKRTIYIPADAYTPSLDARYRPRNAFWQYLAAEFGAAPADAAFDAYRLGTSAHYGGGACLFPLFDATGCASAQIIKVDAATGRTVRFAEGRATTWLHSVVKKRPDPPGWLADYDGHAEKWPFLFGLHLALMDSSRSVCIVESAKTAVVQSLAMPAFLWLAVGSKDWLNPARLQALKGRTVLLVPDGGKGAADWTAKVPLLRSHGFKVDTVDLGLPDGDDIADIRPDTAPETGQGATHTEAAATATSPRQEADTSPAEPPGGYVRFTGQPIASPLPTPPDASDLPDYPADWDGPSPGVAAFVYDTFPTGPILETEVERIALLHGRTFAEVQGCFEYLRCDRAEGKPVYWYVLPERPAADIAGPVDTVQVTPHVPAGSWSSYMAGETLPGLWDAEIAAVEAALSGRELSEADALFVSGHMGYVRANNGRRVYRPYIDRLLAFAAGLADAPVVPLQPDRLAA